MQSTSWEMLDWKKHKLEWRLLGDISITSDMHLPSTTTYTQPLPLSESHTRRVRLGQPMKLLSFNMITQSPWLPLGFTLDTAYSLSFGKCIMIAIHHYSITQNSFAALKVLCAVPVYPSLPVSPDNQWSFYCSQSFAFSRMSYSWGNSLMVHCLGLHILTAEGPGSIPGWGAKISQAVWCSQQKQKNK